MKVDVPRHAPLILVTLTFNERVLAHTSYPIPTHWELVWMVLEEVEVEVLDMVDVVVGVARGLSSSLPNLLTRSSSVSTDTSVGSSIGALAM